MTDNNHEVLEVIHELATQMDKRFDDVDKRFDDVDKHFEGIEKEIVEIKATMVTKDYLDDKLADLKGDIIVKQRKIESRIDTLVTMLQNRNLLQSADVKLLSDLRVFPHMGE